MAGMPRVNTDYNKIHSFCFTRLAEGIIEE
jgi:hypothetical protein